MSNSRWVLEFADGRAPFAVSQGEVIVGKAASCTVRLEADGVGDRHVRLTTDASGGVSIQDLDSYSGTLKNGDFVYGVQALADGDEIRLGQAVFHFRAAGAPARTILPPNARTQMATETPPEVKAALARTQPVSTPAPGVMVGTPDPEPVDHRTVQMESGDIEALLKQRPIPGTPAPQSFDGPAPLPPPPGSVKPLAGASPLDVARSSQPPKAREVPRPAAAPVAPKADELPFAATVAPVAPKAHPSTAPKRTMMGYAPAFTPPPSAPAPSAPAPASKSGPTSTASRPAVTPPAATPPAAARPVTGSRPAVAPPPATASRPVSAPRAAVMPPAVARTTGSQPVVPPPVSRPITAPHAAVAPPPGTPPMTSAATMQLEPPVLPQNPAPPHSAPTMMATAPVVPMPFAGGTTPPVAAPIAPMAAPMAAQQAAPAAAPFVAASPKQTGPYTPPEKGPFGAFSRALAFMTQMFALGKQNPVIFKPVIYDLMITTPISIAISVGFMFVHSQGAFYALLGVGTAMLYFVDYACNSLTASLMYDQATTGDAKLENAMPRVKKALPGILTFAAVSAALDMASTYARERNDVVSRIVLRILRAIWTTATYVIMPALVIEGVSFGDAFKRSKVLMDQDPTGVGAGVVAMSLTSYIAGAVIFPIAYFSLRYGGMVHPILGGILFFTFVNLYWSVSGWLKVAYSTCFYMWARECERTGSTDHALAPLPLRTALDAG